MKIRHALLIAVVGGITYPPAAPAEVRYIDQVETENVVSWARIELHGKIELADVSKLKKILPKAISNSHGARIGSFISRPVVVLNSRGGDVLAALAIGRELRKQFAWVMVPEGAHCHSACIFILAGGSNRSAFGETLSLGIHRPYFSPTQFARLSPSDAKGNYDANLRQVADYLSDMGVSQELFLAMTAISSADMKFLTREWAVSVNLLGDDPAFQEWVRAKEIEKYGAEWVALRDSYIKCLNKGLGDACTTPPAPVKKQ